MMTSQTHVLTRACSHAPEAGTPHRTQLCAQVGCPDFVVDERATPVVSVAQVLSAPAASPRQAARLWTTEAWSARPWPKAPVDRR